METLMYVSHKFLNPELTKATTGIRTAGENIRKNYLKIAHLLHTIDAGEMYLDDDFEDVIEYASKVFGIGKSTTYTFVKIGRDWVNEDGTRTILTESGRDYTISQIGQISRLDVKTAKKLQKNGEIDPSMSVRKLKAIIDEILNEVTPADAEEGDGEESEGNTPVKKVGKITFMDDGEIAIEGDFPEWFTIELDEMYKKVLEGAGE